MLLPAQNQRGQLQGRLLPMWRCSFSCWSYFPSCIQYFWCLSQPTQYRVREKKSSKNRFESREIYMEKCSNLDNPVMIISEITAGRSNHTFSCCSFLKIASSAGQNSYCGISSGVIQRISLCSSILGVPSMIAALNSVRCTFRSG